MELPNIQREAVPPGPTAFRGLRTPRPPHFTGLRHELLDPRAVRAVLDKSPEDLRPKLRRAYADLARELAPLACAAEEAEKGDGE